MLFHVNCYLCYKVYDQYLDFITLEDDLFCLRQAGRDSISYYGKKILLTEQRKQQIRRKQNSLF